MYTDVLGELPRDFHFCSLGYSRPKRAPMVPYSPHLGVPSFLWYLTGYVISLDGARRLLGELPVSGPVDSWMGLKMLSNWDNVHGEGIGVARDSRRHNVSEKAPSRREMARILKFRAFAALVPLCSQRTGGSGWTDRDTDIVGSGRKS